MELNTYIHFNEGCEAAFRYYAEHLGGRIAYLSRYGDNPATGNLPAEMKDKIIHARLELGQTVLFGSDCPPDRKAPNAGFTLSLTASSVAEGERIFAALSNGGKVEQPLEKSFFADRFGMVTDRWGIPWMVLAGIHAQ